MIAGDDVRQRIEHLEMQLAPFLVLVSLVQAAGGGWTAAGTTRGVTL